MRRAVRAMTTKTERCQRCGATVPVTDEDTHGLCESCGLAELETWGEVQAEDARHDAVDAFRRYLEETDGVYGLPSPARNTRGE